MLKTVVKECISKYVALTRIFRSESSRDVLTLSGKCCWKEVWDKDLEIVWRHVKHKVQEKDKSRHQKIGHCGITL